MKTITSDYYGYRVTAPAVLFDDTWLQSHKEIYYINKQGDTGVRAVNSSEEILGLLIQLNSNDCHVKGLDPKAVTVTRITGGEAARKKLRADTAKERARMEAEDRKLFDLLEPKVEEEEAEEEEDTMEEVPVVGQQYKCTMENGSLHVGDLVTCILVHKVKEEKKDTDVTLVYIKRSATRAVRPIDRFFECFTLVEETAETDEEIKVGDVYECVVDDITITPDRGDFITITKVLGRYISYTFHGVGRSCGLSKERFRECYKLHERAQ